MSSWKPDSAEMKAFVEELTRADWLSPAQSHWPRYLFHLTDITNAVSILNTGLLLSRAKASAAGLLVSDNASAEIIRQTNPLKQKFARLYFRPRTPTFFSNEGIRPISARVKNAHRPMPIAFLFDSERVLSAADSIFTDGNFARGQCKQGDSVSFLRSLPFNLIYHNIVFSAEERDEIVYRRQAEVLIPDELPLAGFLRAIFVRSPAEYETLLSLLDFGEVSISAQDRSLIRVNSQYPLFFKYWSYVENVTIYENTVRVNFNPSSRTPGPFDGLAEFADPTTGITSSRASKQELMTTHPSKIRIPEPWLTAPFLFRLSLDNCLTYQSVLNPTQDITLFT